jgi:hypothetical protein
MEVNAIFEGERSVFAQLDSIEPELFRAIRQDIEELTHELATRVRAAAPHGKTGRLAGSVHSSVRVSEHRVVGIVTASAPYLPVIEFGIHKELHVSAHTRRLSHAWMHNFPPEQVSVDPYERMADVEATFFMEHALESMMPEIVGRLRQTIEAFSGIVGNG